jgi:hypothetical protein
MARGISQLVSQDHCLKVVASMVRVEITEAETTEAVAVTAKEGSHAAKDHVVVRAVAKVAEEDNISVNSIQRRIDKN